jgi:hypothetical protein
VPQRPERADASIILRAWLEDHPVPLRVVITVVPERAGFDRSSVTSVDEAVSIVRDALVDLLARGRDGPVTRS